MKLSKKTANLPAFHKISFKAKLIWLLCIILSVPIGAFFGLFLGLISTTFIPMCCNDNGCHNCLVFRGMVGYEAAAYIGMITGALILPLIVIIITFTGLRKVILHS